VGSFLKSVLYFVFWNIWYVFSEKFVFVSEKRRLFKKLTKHSLEGLSGFGFPARLEPLVYTVCVLKGALRFLINYYL